MKGLIVSIFEDKRIGNCSGGGISENRAQLLLVGEGVPKIFEMSGPKIIIENHYADRFRAIEVGEDGLPITKEGFRGPMFGGTFVWSSDSRFPVPYPVALHDRWEKYNG